MIHSFHGIAKMTTAKSIHIKLINNMYKHEPKNNINLKKTSITYNTNKCFEITVKLSNIFITFNEKKNKNYQIY